jgi:glucosamine-6-phosphate deaminase
MRPRLIVGDTAAVVAERIADRIVDLANARTLRVLGVATGSSPSAVYLALASRKNDAVRSLELFALDEYVGLEYSLEQSYHAVVEDEIRTPLRVDPARVHVPDGMAADLDRAAKTYEESISRAGGIGFQILGIGANGHIGFNEPGSPFDSRTRRVELTEETRAANSRFFSTAEEVPEAALTQGIGTIMEADEIVLLANGLQKARAIATAIEGPVDPNVPASILQTHPNVTFALDWAAASALSQNDRTLLAAENW